MPKWSKPFVEPFQYPRAHTASIGHVPDAADKVKKKARANDRKGTLLKIWRYLAVSRFHLILVMVMVILSSLFALMGPFLIGIIIDDYLMTNAYSGLYKILIGIGFVYMMYSLTIRLQTANRFVRLLHFKHSNAKLKGNPTEFPFS